MAKILIVDDSFSARKFIAHLLKNAGHEITEAEDGQTCLKIVKEQKLDLIVLDIVMPEKEGIETILEFRRLFPEARIVAVSGGGKIDADSYLNLARRIGAVATLTKPFSWSQLLDVVQKALTMEK